MRILFVCRGNTCRSPMAAQLLLHTLSAVEGLRVDPRGADGIEVSSAGTDAVAGDPMNPLAREYVRRATGGLVLPHRARRLSPAELAHADLVLAMTGDVRHAVVRMSPALSHRVFTLVGFAESVSQAARRDRDIPDPYGLGAGAYRRAGDRIAAAVDVVARSLSATR